MLSMADFLVPVLTGFPESLADDAARRRICGVAALFPGYFAFRNFGFECPLGTEEPVMDFSLTALIHPRWRVSPGDGGMESFPELPFDHPVWSRMKRLEAVWGDPASSRTAGMKNVLLEFDVATTDLSAPVPAVFLTMSLDGTDRPSLFDTLAIITGKPLDSAQISSISGVLDALPPLARVPHVGAMLSRTTDAFRFNIRMSLHAVMDYLERIGWEGPKDRVLETVDYLLSRGHVLTFLDIDVGREIGGRVELECFFDPGRDGAVRLGAMTGDLEARGRCAASKGRALAFPATGAPVFVREGGYESDRPFLPFPHYFTKRVSHLKFSITPQRPVTVKAYLIARYTTALPAALYDI